METGCFRLTCDRQPVTPQLREEGQNQSRCLRSMLRWLSSYQRWKHVLPPNPFGSFRQR